MIRSKSKAWSPKGQAKAWYHPYKSGLEKRVAEALGDGWVYEKVVLKFTPPAKERRYNVDFSRTLGGSTYIEVKGRISRLDELKKVVWAREQNPGTEIIWIIQNPKGRAYPQSKVTLGEWLTKNNFKWYTSTDVIEGKVNIDSLIRDELKSSENL